MSEELKSAAKDWPSALVAITGFWIAPGVALMEMYRPGSLMAEDVTRILLFSVIVPAPFMTLGMVWAAILIPKLNEAAVKWPLVGVGVIFGGVTLWGAEMLIVAFNPSRPRLFLSLASIFALPLVAYFLRAINRKLKTDLLC